MNEHLNRDEHVLADILCNARVLFQKQGLKKTTMDDIASRIGKCKGALYYYFSSKDEIFEAVLQQEMTEFFRQLSKATSEAGGAREKLVAYCHTRLLKQQEISNLNILLKKDLIEFAGRLEPIKKKYDSLQVTLVKDILHEGIQNGVFRALEPGFIHDLACLMVSTFKGLETPLHIDTRHSNLAQKAEFIVQVMVDGIGCHQEALQELLSLN